MSLEQLTAARVDQVYSKLLREGRAGGEGGLSPSSVRYTHVLLRRSLGDGVRKGLLARNPTDAADPPSASEAKAPAMQTWTGAEVARFLEQVGDDRLTAAWRVAASTGMRRGEILGLRWRDVDLDACVRARGRHAVVAAVVLQGV